MIYLLSFLFFDHGYELSKSRFCKKKEGKDQSNNFDDEHLFADQLAAIQHDDKKAPVEHHIYQGKWITRPSKPHPVVMANLKPMPEEHRELNHSIPKTSLKERIVPMIADSGCQSTIIPYDTARAMSYKQEDIMPVKLSMRGAIKEDLGVEGVSLLKLA